MISTSFRIAREVSREHGPFTLELGGITSKVTLKYTADRKIAPPGRPIGTGAIVVVVHRPLVARRRSDGSYDEEFVAAEAVRTPSG